ncbi:MULTISPECIES: hypothetical protein [Streptomyces]|uniref:Uncharacterized protein n=1 Tax=Streptomyces glycanivorans TaxID=3033808 RepID=A0ABY9JDF6_9ACTN|nr:MULTISPECIES: hypothetical protein [unclassified Streptomyces]WSQ79210.1 hypothetical protein OG725_19830 [Streptomyces sp. NBC_01213]TXS17420.1 hypothetical protein EAO68_06395 [Streptomyces sp. wa22]WLQ65795.1 hypothetical protein P8A20_20355 [Streptomyces sp. Alt3]WSQ86578.1 hypothetical protein OG722_20440 [Streptomyces sp. NBC_01212]WSR07372.1 hypothetical protein OG265_15800 [Streptomyces sp. NBC_01208]
MDALLLALSVPAVVVASGVFTVCDCRRRRSRPPLPYTRRAARRASRDVLLLAESVVDGAYAALGGLYADPASPQPDQPAPVVSGGAGASRGHGPSWPAPARKP